MKAIVAADENWGIGKDNRLLVSIPRDMQFFRNETAGKVVLLGRRTLESFPGGKPLAGRQHILLTRQRDYTLPGVVVVHSVEEALAACKAYAPDEIYCIGGEQIYKAFLPYCETVFVTRIMYAYEADAHFPDLDSDPRWRLAGCSEEQTYFDLEYEFRRYERISPLSETGPEE